MIYIYVNAIFKGSGFQGSNGGRREPFTMFISVLVLNRYRILVVVLPPFISMEQHSHLSSFVLLTDFLAKYEMVSISHFLMVVSFVCMIFVLVAIGSRLGSSISYVYIYLFTLVSLSRALARWLIILLPTTRFG